MVALAHLKRQGWGHNPLYSQTKHLLYIYVGIEMDSTDKFFGIEFPKLCTRLVCREGNSNSPMNGIPIYVRSFFGGGKRKKK